MSMKSYKVRRIRLLRLSLRRTLKVLKKRAKSRRLKRRPKWSGVSRSSQLLGYLMSRGFEKRTQIRSESVILTIPKTFSFSENPEETIDLLQTMFHYGVNRGTKSLYFDHSNCEELGICASTVMDVILLEIRNYKKKIRKFGLRGRLPEPGYVRDILQISGILKHLGFKEPQRKDVEKLELIECGNSGIVATRVADYYKRCLSRQKLTLHKAGVNLLSKMVGEVIDNCSIHGGVHSKWYTLGHYQQIQDRDYGQCHLVLFNFGNTIYESLKSAETSQETVDSLNALTASHRQWFRLFTQRWSEETLWTLYALQDGVSRFRDKVLDPDRGTGTIIMLESFQSVGKNKYGERPVMSITSGHTHIYFDGTYNLSMKDNRQIIAFNEQNDLFTLPDEKYVKKLKNFFPGTVISMKFYIDHEFISRSGDEHNENRFKQLHTEKCKSIIGKRVRKKSKN